jgi:hypothetical protein
MSRDEPRDLSDPGILCHCVVRRRILQAGVACAVVPVSRSGHGAGPIPPAAPDGLTILLRPGPAHVDMVRGEIPAAGEVVCRIARALATS